MPISFDPRDSRVIHWIRNYSSPAEPRFDADAGWSRFQRERGMGRQNRRSFFAPQSVVWRIAAVLVVVAGGTMYWRARETSAPPAMVERVAANGQRTIVTLGDGSRVTLNGGSRIRYPANAGARDRDVYLEGEGFFEIAHNPSRTLRVHAGRGIVEDIGTRFNVRAYRGSSTVEVVVTEGTVAFARDTSSSLKLQLGRGEGATLGVSGPPAKMANVSIDRYVAWTTGSLVFDNTTLRDAATELEHQYGVRIDVERSLATRSVTARFHGESIDKVLDALTYALGVRYERNDSTYSIRPGIR